MKHIPNILTSLRLLIVPFIPITYHALSRPKLTLLLTVIAALSDFFDGFIARRYQLITPLGKVLDPLADKLFLFSIILTLYFSGDFSLVLLIIYLLIDLGMIIAGIILFTKKERLIISSNIFGKVATTLFFTAAFLALFIGYSSYVHKLFILTITMKIFALISYISFYTKAR